MSIILIISVSESTKALKQNDSKKSKSRVISGNSEIDSVIHRFLDYIFRDFIDGWYTQISDNNDFKINARNIIEECLINLIKRLKNAPLLSTISTKLIDDIAEHSKAYHDAIRMVIF